MSVHAEYLRIIEERHADIRHKNDEAEEMYLCVLYGPAQFEEAGERKSTEKR